MQVTRNWRYLFPNLTDRALAPFYFLIGAMAVYAAFTPLLYAPYRSAGWHLVACLLLALITLGGATVRYDLGTRAYRVLLRSIVALCVFYIFTSRMSIAPDLIDSQSVLARELKYGWMVAVACGVIAMFRPSFAIVPLMYIVWHKQQLTQVFGLHIDWMDHFTVIETGAVLTLGYLFFALLRVRFASSMFEYRSAGETPGRTGISIHPIDLLVIVAVALHFGNYFYAGMIKLALGLHHPLLWVLDNQTQTLLPAALESGVLPISFSSSLTHFAYEALADVRVLTNFITISTQLLAVVAITRIRWAILITLCYDVLHVMIFILSGIFFWKFIILNLAIVAALSTMQIRVIPRRLKIFFCSTIVLSPLVFQIMPSYAWLDSRSMNSVHIVAVTEDGAEYRVPSNYFLGASVTFAQHRLIWPEYGPLTTQTWGTTRNHDVMLKGLACDWDYADGALPIASWHAPKEQISNFIRRHHRQMLTLVDETGFYDYDLFPHHIFSTPWVFTDFKALDKRRIAKYRYEIKALCVSYEDGTLKKDVMWSNQFDISL